MTSLQLVHLALKYSLQSMHQLINLTSRGFNSSYILFRYGRGLGLFSADSPLSIPNGLYGVVGYTVLILLGKSSHAICNHIQHTLSFAFSNKLCFYVYVYSLQ